MSVFRARSRRLALAAWPLVAALAASAGAEDLGAAAARVFAARSPAVVSVRVTIKSETEQDGAGQERERTLNTVGALVDPHGLVQLWNGPLSSKRLADLLGAVSGRGEPFHFKITPTDFHVLLPGESVERRAFLAGSDTDLDLAYLQIEPPPEKPLPAVDFARAAALHVGDVVIGVGRLSAAFDRAPFFEVGRLAGEIEKPRQAWIVDGGLSGIGLPVYGADGTPAGALVTVLSRSGDAGDGDDDFLQQFLLGTQSPTRGPLGVFVLPAARVRDVIAQAEKRATALLAEHASSAGKGAGDAHP